MLMLYLVRRTRKVEDQHLLGSWRLKLDFSWTLAKMLLAVIEL